MGSEVEHRRTVVEIQPRQAQHSIVSRRSNTDRHRLDLSWMHRRDEHISPSERWVHITRIAHLDGDVLFAEIEQFDILVGQGDADPSPLDFSSHAESQRGPWHE